MATKLGTLTLDLVAKIGNFTQGMRQASSSAEREMQRASNSVNIMNGMLGKLAATAGTVFSINQIKNYADSYTGIVNQLKLVTNGQAELNTAMNDTYKIAQATASSWGAVNTVYSKYMSNAKVLNLTQAETARLTEVTSKAVSISGSTTEAAAGALFQFGQALDGNILRAEEYNSLVDGAGGLLNAMAKGLGVTRGELRQMMLDGKLSGQVITEALLKAGDSVDALYFKTDTTMAASFNLITTEVTKMVGEFDSATGASKTFVEGITLLSQNMDALVDVTMVAGAYWAGTYIPVLVKGTQATIADTASKVTGTLASRAKAIADYEVAKSNLAATAAMVRAMGVTNAQTAAMMANARAAYQQAAASRAAAVAGTGALGLLGGPVGIGVTLAAVAAGYLLMRDSTEESTKSLRENNESVDDAIKKYKELDEVQRRAQLVSEKNTLQDLAKEYDEINSKLITATYSFSRHNDMTSEQSKQVNALIAEYKKTGDIDQFSGKINALNFISQTSKDRFNTLGGSVKDAGNEFKNQKSFVDQMAPAVKGVGDQAKQTAIETANLSAEIRKLLSEANQTIKDSAITSALANRGYNDTMIELAKKYLNVEGAIVTNAKGQKVLKDELKTKLREEYQAIMRSKNAVDERNKAEEKSKKLLEATGNAMKVNAKVAANAAKYNFAAIEAKNKLPEGLLSAIHMQESRGNANAYNKSSGAAGGFQFLEGTAKQYGVKDRYNLAQSAAGAGKYMAYLLDLFKGDLDKAVSAYHAGEGNVQRGTNIGPVNRQYVKNIKGYLGGSSGVSFTEDYSFDDWLKELEQHVAEQEKLEKELAETKKAIQVSYYNEWQNLEYDNQERIKEIEKAFATDPTERDRLLDLQQKAYGEDVANWIKAQDERVKAENEANQQIILARRNAFAMMNEPLGAMNQMGIDAKAQASMSPQQYQKWQLNNDQQAGYSQLSDELYSAQSTIENNEYLETTERYRQLEQAYEAYLQNKAALSEAYNKQERELAQTQFQEQLSLWGGILANGQNTFSQLTQSLKKSAGEQSTTYKTMFALQQGFSVASSLVAAYTAYAQAFADPSAMTLPQKFLGATAVMAALTPALATIATISIDGMAHDGIDNIPKEGTWLLDKGERVVDSRTNGDLKDFIANGGSAPNVNVYTLPGETADVSWNDGRLDVRIRKITRETIMEDARNPNSGFSKAMKQNFTVSTRRL